jgi:hypothetical protein
LYSIALQIAEETADVVNFGNLLATARDSLNHGDVNRASYEIIVRRIETGETEAPSFTSESAPCLVEGALVFLEYINELAGILAAKETLTPMFECISG